mmetsp:Transcript_2881/g.4337  ORF Transcript_2881/g.4337 Transcript_2881/m.4337 type:complete len:333 (-) Transcript_2881:37-1035(-)|eukprot:CAMPEP_0171454264 /NCGR_PEP_ID=MMETSP0945-20130129/1621_1 /TAXON_ID=109269 /ORGANISM="Vaucheria litorea, Strain CCMP2940" /LENGTH=332 /DNA_ID=CAMNT_0011979255 /DNA_START=236 /DNA_END=1237 /DNA_ORIENTATION=+
MSHHHKPKEEKPDDEHLNHFTGDIESWRDQSVVSVKQFGTESLLKLFEVSNDMKKLVKSQGGDERLKRKILATLFYENSTRTRCSMEAAMLRLGGSVIPIHESTSSVKKGETLVDTILSLCSYCDFVVLRHPQVGASMEALKVAKKPIINAGDGVGEHPTQALLDVFTIHNEFKSVEGKVIALLGDLKNGRTVHSLVQLLGLYDCEIHCVSPVNLKLPCHLIEEVENGKKARIFEAEVLDEILPKCDVLYVTRVQKERFDSAEEYEASKEFYIITPQVLESAKNDMILMHPLPRVNEISHHCDSDPRAAYLRQMENGMYVRMALLALISGKV